MIHQFLNILQYHNTHLNTPTSHYFTLNLALCSCLKIGNLLIHLQANIQIPLWSVRRWSTEGGWGLLDALTEQPSQIFLMLLKVWCSSMLNTPISALSHSLSSAPTPSVLYWLCRWSSSRILLPRCLHYFSLYIQSEWSMHLYNWLKPNCLIWHSGGVLLLANNQCRGAAKLPEVPNISVSLKTFCKWGFYCCSTL